MRLIIVRHGETVENKEGITQGQNQGKLSEIGLKQVEKLANYLKNEKIDLVYCSDLGRCRESIAPLLKIIKMEANYSHLLRERGKGIFEGKPTGELKEWGKNNPNKAPPGGETPEDVDKRAETFLTENSKKWKDKTVLIMTHGGTKVSLLKMLLVKNKDNSEIIEKGSPNASVTVVELDKNKKLFISKLHYNEHLGDLK
ncbi:MAG: histidine phosphatase family protein [Nanoarchaeota archaeon]